MNTDILILRNNAQIGPYSEAQIVQFLTAGNCTPDDMAWRPGMAEWQTLKDGFPGLLGASGAARPSGGAMPPPPPPGDTPTAAPAASGKSPLPLVGLVVAALGLGAGGAWWYLDTPAIPLRTAAMPAAPAPGSAANPLPGPIAPPAAQQAAPRHNTSPPQPLPYVATGMQSATPPTPGAAPAVAPPCRNCATIVSIQARQVKGSGSGTGAAIGGLVGGILGNQVGHGGGRAAATLLGAGGGALVGNEIERSQKTATQYEILLRYEDGHTRTLKQREQPVWREGDAVIVEDGRLLSRR